MYTPESVDVVLPTRSVLVVFVPITSSAIVVLSLVAASTTVPLWVHSRLGAGDPSALQTSISSSVLVTLLSSGGWKNS